MSPEFQVKLTKDLGFRVEGCAVNFLQIVEASYTPSMELCSSDALLKHVSAHIQQQDPDNTGQVKLL